MYELTSRSIQTVTAGTPESNADNIRSALARGLPEFSPTPCIHDGTFVIVGSGSSLPSVVESIMEERKKRRPICAINGAHDFLVENGIEPDLFVSVDPRTTILENVKHKNDRTAYLLASRVNPAVFDHLKDKNIIVWHSWSSRTPIPPTAEPGKVLRWQDFDPLPECEVWRGRFGVGGASTSGLRTINLAYLMGFRNMHLYGMDSCLAADKYTKRFSGENIGDSKCIDVIIDGKRFFCNGALASQAMEFQQVISMFKDMRMTVFGGGLLAAIMEAREKRGWSNGDGISRAVSFDPSS
jgi:hypothetical protein